MAEETTVKQAQAVFSSLCAMLDENEWKYHRDDENLTVECVASGDDLPIPVRIIVDAERQLVTLLSQLPFAVPEQRRDAVAIAVNAANCQIVDGSFDYDGKNGLTVFRMTSGFRESLIGKELLAYMVFVACQTVDDYNDKLLAVATGDISLEKICDFMEVRE